MTHETPSMQDLSKYDEPGESDEEVPSHDEASTLSAICSIPELDNLSNYIDALEIHHEIKVCLHQRVNLLVSALSKQFAAPPALPPVPKGQRRRSLKHCDAHWVKEHGGNGEPDILLGVVFSCPEPHEACSCTHVVYFAGPNRTHTAPIPVSSNLDELTILESFESSCGCRVRIKDGRILFLDESAENDIASKPVPDYLNELPAWDGVPRVEQKFSARTSTVRDGKSSALEALCPDVSISARTSMVRDSPFFSETQSDALRIAAVAEQIFIAMLGNPSFRIGLHSASKLRDNSVVHARKIIEDAEKAAEERASHRSRAGERRPL